MKRNQIDKVIGNTIHNQQIKELNMKIKTKEKIQKEELTSIKSSISEIDFDAINFDATIEKEIHNNGECDFILKDIVSSCDCSE